MSTLYTDNIRANNASQITVPAGQTLYAPGHVIQVVSVADNGNGAYNNSVQSSWQNLLSASITPKSANSKILVTASMTIGTNDWGILLRILQNGSVDPNHYGQTGDSRSSHTFSVVPYAANDDETATTTYCGLFSPGTTSQVTYMIQGGGRTTSNWSYNRSDDSPTTNASRSRGVSSIVLQEIAQ